jgi:hypothetical protein
MPDLDALAQRAVATIGVFSRRAGRLALGTAVFVGMVAAITYAIGIAALSGDAETAWIILGGALVVVAVGAPVLAWWRLASVRRHAPQLVGEVRRMITGDAEAQRVVIDTVETDRSTAEAPPDGRQDRVLVTAQPYQRLRTIALRTDDLPNLQHAMTAVTSFPLLLAAGLALSLVLGFLGFILLIVWAI